MVLPIRVSPFAHILGCTRKQVNEDEDEDDETPDRLRQGALKQLLRTSPQRYIFKGNGARVMMFHSCRIWLQVRRVEATRNSRPDHYFIRSGRQTKLCAALLIQFQGCGNVQLNNLNLPRPRAAAPMIRAGVYG